MEKIMTTSTNYHLKSIQVTLLGSYQNSLSSRKWDRRRGKGEGRMSMMCDYWVSFCADWFMYMTSHILHINSARQVFISSTNY